jgi:hypothetical protein
MMHKHSEAVRREMCTLYVQGISMPEIGKRFGCSKTVVGAILRAANVPIRDRSAAQRAAARKKLKFRSHRVTSGPIFAGFRTARRSYLAEEAESLVDWLEEQEFIGRRV